MHLYFHSAESKPVITESLVDKKSNLDASVPGQMRMVRGWTGYFGPTSYVLKEPTDVSNLTFSPENVPASGS
jgi:hypothetical protein